MVSVAKPWLICGYHGLTIYMVNFGIVASNAVSGETESVVRAKRIAYLPHIIIKNRTIFKVVFIMLKLT